MLLCCMILSYDVVFYILLWFSLPLYMFLTPTRLLRKACCSLQEKASTGAAVGEWARRLECLLIPWRQKAEVSSIICFIV